MGREKKVKKLGLAYKVVFWYLLNHILLVLAILFIADRGISMIENRFLEKYKSNVEESVETLNLEILQLKNILSYTMNDENIQTLMSRKDQLSAYQEMDYKLKINDNLTVLASQYRYIDDIGIYIPDYELWIDVKTWFANQRPPAVGSIGERLEIQYNKLYLILGMQNNGKYMEGYIRFNSEELLNLMKMKVDEHVVTEIRVNGRLLEADAPPNLDADEGQYREIAIESDIYPIEVRFYVPTEMLTFREYLYLLGAVTIVLLAITTIIFSRYLNRAIHRPLKNMVHFMEGMKEQNYKDYLDHQGREEFQYVTLEFNQMKDHLESYIKQRYEQDISMKQMELDHLQEQIKPHFLYNCFANISNLCKTCDVEKVEKLSLALSRYYSYITRTGKSMVTLQAEYDHMKNYLTIQKIRFKGRVEIKVSDLPEEAREIRVPRLILQPIVENAYKYVFEHVEGNAHLHIHAEAAQDSVSIMIEDSGYNTTDEDIERARQALQKTDGNITGLGNLQKRLQFIDADNGMQIGRSSLGGVLNKLTIRKKGR